MQAVLGQNENRKIKRALISVFDKTNIEEIASFLESLGVKILSTGGSYQKLKNANIPVQEVSDYTGSDEIFDGRVKTLHPKIHGGLLFVRGNQKHEKESREKNIDAIDLVICNLYPFENAVKQHAGFYTCVENIDIGGPCMIRAAAKNSSAVCVVTSPLQYDELKRELTLNDGSSTPVLRKKFAAHAFKHTAEYDQMIADYFAKNFSENKEDENEKQITKIYKPKLHLKYGCNPHQTPAAICTIDGNEIPFTIRNGKPGYINILDAIFAWQLVKELKTTTGMIAAASFKHCSPAGAALGVVLTAHEREIYDIAPTKELTLSACAYVRARNADPLCSFGDFAALSHEVDEQTALFLKTEVSDGIIAPSYTDKAIQILSEKKSGNFIILQADDSFIPSNMEYREIYGMAFMQKRNDKLFSEEHLNNFQTGDANTLSESAKLDMILASTTLKYTQSNSVSYVYDRQVIGVGAGQQSRVDCVKLAAKKVATWYFRSHPKVMGLKFRDGVKRQERVNARVRYIEGNMNEIERNEFNQLFTEHPSPLSEEEKEEFLKSLTDVTISSDAFFPFRDSIDVAAKHGVKYVVQPGGSVQDEEVKRAAQQYGMTMVHTNFRLFLH